MRLIVLFAAFAALWMQPAKAVEGLDSVVELRLSGTVDVTRTRYACDGNPANCGPILEYFPQPWTFSLSFLSERFASGMTTFDFGNFYGRGNYTGTISYLGDGFFSGSDLTFSRDGNMKSCAATAPECYAYLDYGTASTFDVVAVNGAVPEPSAWMLMLVGIFATGAALRLRPAAPFALRHS